jgi:hypothetical protein
MSTMSPELALVDPELRADAIARLPAVYANAFLEFPPDPAPVPTWAFAPGRVVAPSRSRASAALAYLVLALMRTLVFEVAVFAAVFAAVLVASLLG